MSWRETAKQIGMLTPNRRHVIAMNYLERHGQRFCVDFGTATAIDKARELRRKIRLERTRRGSR